jgi:hypothetical protein
MYDGDTFFSLTMAARFGLVCLSMGLAALTAAAFIKVTCRMFWPLRLLLAPAFLWVFVWLSPQAFYLYYMMLFDYLPLQNVVQSPPRPWQIVHLLGFSGKAALSHHATGVLGWGLIVLAILGERAVPTQRLRVVLRL